MGSPDDNLALLQTLIKSDPAARNSIAVNLTWTQHMTEPVANALATRAAADVQVAEKTHAIPAREETKRHVVSVATNTGMAIGLVTIAGVVLRGSGQGWQVWFTSVLIAVAAIFGPGIKHAIEALTKKD